jgi:hypothetical protein
MIMITQYADTFTMSAYEKESPSLMDGNKTHALNHQASYALYYRPRTKSSLILEHDKDNPDVVKNKILGHIAKVEIKKSASDNTGYTLEIPIKKGRVGNAVWTEREIFDTLVTMESISKSGSWYEMLFLPISWINDENNDRKKKNELIEKENEKLKEEEKKPLLPMIELQTKFQGTEAFSEYFEENQEIMQIFVKNIQIINS